MKAPAILGPGSTDIFPDGISDFKWMPHTPSAPISRILDNMPTTPRPFSSPCSKARMTRPLRRSLFSERILAEIGRASCREREEVTEVGMNVKQKERNDDGKRCS